RLARTRPTVRIRMRTQQLKSRTSLVGLKSFKIVSCSLSVVSCNGNSAHIRLTTDNRPLTNLMKRCPSCNRTFEDDWLAFCTEDGTTLVESGPLKQEPPPTVQISAPNTNPSSQP